MERGAVVLLPSIRFVELVRQNMRYEVPSVLFSM